MRPETAATKAVVRRPIGTKYQKIRPEKRLKYNWGGVALGRSPVYAENYQKQTYQQVIKWSIGRSLWYQKDLEIHGSKILLGNTQRQCWHLYQRI